MLKTGFKTEARNLPLFNLAYMEFCWIKACGCRAYCIYGVLTLIAIVLDSLLFHKKGSDHSTLGSTKPLKAS